jgi:DNA polymerase-3 subunit alpha
VLFRSYLSGPPIEAWNDVIAAVCSGTLRELILLHAQPAPVNAEGKPTWQPRVRSLFATWVKDLRFFKGDGKFSRSSYKLTLEDRGKEISTWIDADKWAQWQGFVKVDSLLFVCAEIGLSPGKEGREPEPRLYNAEFLSPAQLMNDYATRLVLSFRRGAREVAELRRLLTPFRSDRGAAVTVEYANARARTVLDFAADWRLRVEPASLDLVQKLLGPDCVKVIYKRYEAPVPERRFSGNRSFAGAAADDE